MTEFDCIVYGATGFTGRLVAEYMAQTHRDARWAIAGRSRDRLERVRDAIGAAPDLPLIVADADDPASLAAMAARTRVVLTTVGPYQAHGEPLVAACVAAGTGYVDLCGEPGWMAAMIDRHADAARTSGARIVFSCGFDSIPFDLGVWTLQEAARARFGHAAPRVKGRVRQMQGGFSGGTAASFRATLAAAARDPSLLRLLADPFALTPGFDGPKQPGGMIPEYDPAIGAWVAPFVMAPINTKNVHRTNWLSGHRYGADFVYDEMMVAPGIGDMGRLAAETIAKLNPFAGDKGPQPGEGPTREEREAGFFDLLFVGEMAGGERIDTVVAGDRDPGYGATSRMIAEAALCLAHDIEGEGGIWTPGALMAAPLRDRLVARAGLTFTAG